MTQTPNDPVETPTPADGDAGGDAARPDLPDSGEGAEMGEIEGGSTFEPEEDPEGHDSAS